MTDVDIPVASEGAPEADSHVRPAGDLATHAPIAPRHEARLERVPLARIDRRYERLRLGDPRRQAHVQSQMERELVSPVWISDGVAPGCFVLIDGFKRVRGAEALGWADVSAFVTALDATQSLAAMLEQLGSPGGLSLLEEALLVQEMHAVQGLEQVQIAERLGRDKSWVCRRLQIAERLHTGVLDDVRVGLVSAAVARELVRLPRGNQQDAAQSIQRHGLTSRQARQLVDVLKATAPDSRPAILAAPERHLRTERDPRVPDDPRLSAIGNRLRRQLDRLGSAARRIRDALAESAIGTLEDVEWFVLESQATPTLREARQADLELLGHFAAREEDDDVEPR